MEANRWPLAYKLHLKELQAANMKPDTKRTGSPATAKQLPPTKAKQVDQVMPGLGPLVFDGQEANDAVRLVIIICPVAAPSS